MDKSSRPTDAPAGAPPPPAMPSPLRPAALALGGFVLALAGGLVGWGAGRASRSAPAGSMTPPRREAPAPPIAAEAPRAAPLQKVPDEPLPASEPRVDPAPVVPPVAAAPPVEAPPPPPIETTDPPPAPARIEETRVARESARIDSAGLLEEETKPTLVAAGSLRDSWDRRPASIFRRSVADTLFVPPGQEENRGVTVIRDSSRGRLASSSFWDYSPVTPAGPTLPLWTGASYESFGGGYFARPHQPRRR